MLKIQEIIYEFEGSLNKMMIDDKGQVKLSALARTLQLLMTVSHLRSSSVRSDSTRIFTMMIQFERSDPR